MGKRLLAALGCALVSGVAEGQEPEPLLYRINDAQRARVLAALAGLIILGFAMVLLAWLGARVTQRYRKGTSYFRPTERPPRQKEEPSLGENDAQATE